MKRNATLVVAVAASITLVVGGLLVAISWPTSPGDDSVEAGFARDMLVHHGQAVDMAGIIAKRTSDEGLRFFANDIVLTQQAQIGQMGAWLDLWGLNRTNLSKPPMAWADMKMGSMPGMEASGVAMPGMATPAEVASLRTLPVNQAEVEFLKLMIAHHRGGVHMAEAALGTEIDPHVRTLARSIKNSQTGEIDAMNKMLVARGASPI